jgi:hypothetical protein
MTIPLSNLDNRTFDDLTKELQALIHSYCSEWTDHNVSDPGIMLVELLAWMTENLLYRMNRIPAANEQVLLRLLGNSGTAPIDQERAATIATLQGRWRAVTADDFEALVLATYPSIARARCLADVAIDSAAPDVLMKKIGHVSVVIVPRPVGDAAKPIPEPALIEEVYAFLDQRRLITCRHHVVGPVYKDIALAASVICKPGPKPDEVKQKIITNLQSYYAPVNDADGGIAGGWSFGRDVYESEACTVIEETDGVDHVESLALLKKESATWIECSGKIPIDPNSLVCFDASLAPEWITVAPK